MALFWLSDEAWAAIEAHLPKNQPGARRVDDRRVISGILHVLKAGCRWCDCPDLFRGLTLQARLASVSLASARAFKAGAKNGGNGRNPALQVA